MKKALLYLFAMIIIFHSGKTFCYADPVLKSSSAPKKKTSSKSKKPLLRKGSIYVLSDKQRTLVFYSRSYAKTAKNVFTTTYNVYDSKKQSLANIRAIHDKKLHSVIVEVRDFQVQGNPLVNSEKTTYSTPYLGRFGAIGKVGTGGGKGASSNPGQLMVKFLSKRFDYVNVVSIADAHEDSGKELQVYILDEQAAL